MDAFNRISIHALLAESDARTACRRSGSPYFYPRSPCGERPSYTSAACGRIAISIHALLAESDGTVRRRGSLFLISIHALLAESDLRFHHFRFLVKHFYPRSPCGERLTILVTCLASKNFYPRSPCGERHLSQSMSPRYFTISIHALLAESDVRVEIATPEFKNFYPRSPCGERHHGHCAFGHAVDISIHALLAESDPAALSPRPAALRFLSTLSLRRATGQKVITNIATPISIHALLAESDFFEG